MFFTEEEARFFVAEILLAIEYLHSFDIIYRDLKPENVLIDSEGHAKLADFGLAKENIDERKNATSFCGSPAYLAPEMLKSTGVSKPSDVYQIGTVLYELLTGMPPFYTENLKQLYQNIAKAKLQYPKNCPPVAKDLMMKMMERNPNKRINIENVKKHPFFKDIDWERLAKRELKPPV